MVGTDDHTIPLECDCGAVKGSLQSKAAQNGNWLVCHCRDCQAFVHHCGKADAVLDDHAGTPLVQTGAFALTITSGADALAAVRVTDSKLLRWHCRHCRTPIANTMDDGRWPFLSLLAYGLKGPLPPGSQAPTHVFTKSGCGDTSALRTGGAVSMTLRAIGRIFRDRLTARGRVAPFFRPGEKQPIVPAHLLTAQERAQADESARKFCETRS